MFVLDTDCFSLIDFPGGAATRRLRVRLESVPSEDVVTTIITYEEQTRGWFALLSKARTLPAQVNAYRRLNQHVENYRQWTVLAFDESAAVQYQQLRSLKLKIATMDLKIAAIVLAQSATLITRNVSDFAAVPGLSVEDWTRLLQRFNTPSTTPRTRFTFSSAAARSGASAMIRMIGSVLLGRA